MTKWKTTLKTYNREQLKNTKGIFKGNSLTPLWVYGAWTH